MAEPRFTDIPRRVELLGIGLDPEDLADAIREYRTSRMLADRRRPAGVQAFQSAPWAELERRLHASAQLSPRSSPQAPLVGCSEFGRRVRLDPSTVRRYAAVGRIEGARRIGRSWVIPANATVRPKGNKP